MAPKLAPAAVVEDLDTSASGSDLSIPAPMNETEVRSLNGVHVTVWQPPHAVRSEDWRRVGEAVHQVCSAEHLPLDGNTFCVCRLRVPLECRCHHVDPHPEGGEEAKVEAVKDEGEARREQLKEELQGILDEAAKNRTASMAASIEAKKKAMRDAHLRRKKALKAWWVAEEERVDAIRNDRVPDELRKLITANRARDDAEKRRRDEAEARARAAKSVVEEKTRELVALRDRLRQIGELRAAKGDRKRVERDIKSKQAEINRLIESLELLKHDNELRAAEYDAWAVRAKALEEKYRQMLRNLGPWGEAVLARLEKELQAALDKVTEEHKKRVDEEQVKLDKAQAAFNKMKHDAFHSGGNDKDRIAALRKQIADAEARYQAMLRNINNVTDATPCRSHQDCGAEQRCSNMLCTTIPAGSPCAQHEMCANEQRCTSGRCAVVDEDAQCTVKRDCGNWQKCSASSKCVVVFDGTPCRTATKTCANLHVCDADSRECRGEYDLEEELARRRRDEEALRKQLDEVTEQHVKKLEREVQRMREKHIEESDVVKQVQTLAVERRKLEAGRVRLERELQRRAASYMAGETLPRGAGVAGAMAPGAMSGSSPLDAATEIRKLEEEIERLGEELKRCKTKPHAYVPTCESDLTFQVERLREEVLRRKALLLEEVEQVRGKEKEVAAHLAKCRAEGGGCPPEEEQRLLLSMKNLEDEVERRETEQASQDKVHVMQCLLDHDDNPHLGAVRKMFASSLDDGCRRISALTGVGELRKCLCSDWKAESAIRMQAQQRAAQAEHDRAQAEQTEVTQRAVSERKRSQEKEMAKEVAKELLYEHLKEAGELDDVLSEARKSDPARAARLLAEARAMAEDPKATLREVTSAVAAAASASSDTVKASAELAQAAASLLHQVEAAKAPKSVVEPVALAKKGADAGRAVQEIADDLAEAEAAAKAEGVKSPLMDAIVAAAKKAADAAAASTTGDLTPGGDPLVPLSKVDSCLNDIDSGAIKDNIRKAFSSGHARNGCALLSLASNEVLVRVHKCICDDIEAGGSS